MAQKALQLSAGSAGSDPSKGLKEPMSIQSQIRCSDVLYRANLAGWDDGLVSFSWGLNQGVRGASNRKLTLKDLNLIDGFGPEESGDLSKALLLVLRSGGVHKGKYST